MSLALGISKIYDLDRVVIIGSTYGRELVPPATELQNLNRAVMVIGADLSAVPIGVCKLYGFVNAEFYALNSEGEPTMKNYFDASIRSVGNRNQPL